MLKRWTLSFLSIVGLVALCIIAGFVGATALAASVPVVREGCNSGLVCYVINTSWFPAGRSRKADIGASGHAPVACLGADDRRKIQKLGEILVVRKVAGPVLNFGPESCVPVARVADIVCQALADDFGNKASCSALEEISEP